MDAFVHHRLGRWIVAAPFDRGGFQTPTKDGDVVYSGAPDLHRGWHYANKKDAIKRANAIYGAANG